MTTDCLFVCLRTVCIFHVLIRAKCAKNCMHNNFIASHITYILLYCGIYCNVNMMILNLYVQNMYFIFLQFKFDH